MTNDEMVETIKKLIYHVSLIGETIDNENYPVESLILSMNWSRADITKAHDIFERWNKRLENGEKMSTAEFERDFDTELGVGYQSLKSIILAFYKNYQWTNVCEAYVDAFRGSPSIEYHSIMRRER